MGLLTRSRQGTRRKARDRVRPFPPRPAFTRSRKLGWRETDEAFIARHGLAPAIEYARERVSTAYGEPMETALKVVGYEDGFPFLMADFYIRLGLAEHDPALEKAIETLLDLEDAIPTELRSRYGSAVNDRILVNIIPHSEHSS